MRFTPIHHSSSSQSRTRFVTHFDHQRDFVEVAHKSEIRNLDETIIASVK